MKIAVLHTSYEGSAAPFRDLDPECNPAPYLPEHECTTFFISKMTAARDVATLARQDFDLFINLCDGTLDDDMAGIEVVHALERAGVAFTGADSLFYDPSREAMKMACHSVGVGFPAYWMVRRVEDLADILEALRFPMLVKHPHGYSSIGLTPASRVTNIDQLQHQTRAAVAEYGAALVEEFIEGREFTVLVSEPRNSSEAAWALQPVEFLFPEGETFKHFDLKWKDFEQMQTCSVREEPLASRLRNASALMFAALNGVSYARCDLRMNAAGELFMLEINPNCGVFYPPGSFGGADFILAQDPAGHRGFLQHLIACALRRQQKECKSWELRHRRSRGFGMYAVRDIRPGEIVQRYEERPQALVSRRQVERHWAGVKRQWFDQYAWPMTRDVHVMWSHDPEEWRPINHACDPNTWLEGLDIVARRAIRRGEELTIEYATFCGPAMAPFDCHCGAVHCRRTIRGSDHLLPVIRTIYAEHASDFVRNAWRDISTPVCNGSIEFLDGAPSWTSAREESRS